MPLTLLGRQRADVASWPTPALSYCSVSPERLHVQSHSLQIKTMLVHPSSSTSFPSAEGGLHASARSFSSTSSPTSSIGGHHRGYGWHARTSGGLHRCSTSSATAASTPPNVAIDSKIEQAMDLVKTHLMFAVREEVEVLRARIIDLESHLQSLQAENNVLRSCVPDDVLKKLEKL